jgi:Flp pilus assembly secretin CpaC
VNHLVKEGWAKIVANPELYVRLGEEANFHSGGEFPVSTITENYGHSRKHIEWKPWGLTAKVKPLSNDELSYRRKTLLSHSLIAG